MTAQGIQPDRRRLARVLKEAGSALDPDGVTALVAGILAAPPEIGCSWHALVADPTTKAHQISVETFQGVVQLSGFVDTSEARSRATQVAKGVDGVKTVKNELELRNN